MKRVRAFVLFATAIVLSVCCSGHSDSFVQLERMAEFFPDSARTILLRADTSSYSDNSLAYYHYLLAQCNYNLGQTSGNQARLSSSVKYFEDHKDYIRLMKTRYLEGYNLFHAKEYNLAIVSLLQSARLAEDLGDEFYAGLACREASRTFEATSSVDDELNYIIAAYNHFIKGDYGKHARYALLLIGDAYARKGDVSKAIEVYLQAQDEARLYRDSVLMIQATWPLAMQYVDEGNTEEAIRLFDYLTDSIKYSLSAPSVAYQARAYALVGNRKAYKTAIEKALSLADSPYERYIVNLQNYKAAMSVNDNTSALSAAGEAISYLTGNDYNTRNSIALKSQRDYLEEKEQAVSLEVKLLRQKRISLILTAILCLMLVFSVSAYIIRRISEERKSLKKEKHDLLAHIDSMETSHSENLKKSTKSGMAFFNALTQLYWQNQPNKVLPELERILSGLVSDEQLIKSMIKSLNETRGQLIDRLVEQVPSLNSREIILYCYIASGLDRNTICTILDKNPSAVNAQVYRLRTKISESGAVDSSEFLDVIS